MDRGMKQANTWRIGRTEDTAISANQHESQNKHSLTPSSQQEHYTS
jgi:hypothetical protein